MHSAKGPVSRILSCAVIPLGAALPRTLISDLPGGFGQLLGAALRRRAGTGHGPCSWPRASLPIWSCSVWGLPCHRHYCRRGAARPADHLGWPARAHRCNGLGRMFCPVIFGYTRAGRRTGRSLPEQASACFGGGKSELRRAVCRITSGTRASRSVDGQCHRKDTASATPLRRASGRAKQVRLDGHSRRGKGEKVR